LYFTLFLFLNKKDLPTAVSYFIFYSFILSRYRDSMNEFFYSFIRKILFSYFSILGKLILAYLYFQKSYQSLLRYLSSFLRKYWKNSFFYLWEIILAHKYYFFRTSLKKKYLFHNIIFILVFFLKIFYKRPESVFYKVWENFFHFKKFFFHFITHRIFTNRARARRKRNWFLNT